MTGRTNFESVIALSQECAREREISHMLEQHDQTLLPVPDGSVCSPSAATLAMERVLAKKKRAAPGVIPWRPGLEAHPSETGLQEPREVERGGSGRVGRSGYVVHDPYEDNSMAPLDLQHVELMTEERREALSKTDLSGETFTVRLTFPPKPVVEQAVPLPRMPVKPAWAESVEVPIDPAPAVVDTVAMAAQPEVAVSLPTASPVEESVLSPPPQPPSVESEALLAVQERSVATEIERELLASMLESAQVARESARMVRESAVLAAESANALRQAVQTPNGEKKEESLRTIQPEPSLPPVKPERVIVPVEKLFSGLSSAWGDVLDSVVGRRPPKKRSVRRSINQWVDFV